MFLSRSIAAVVLSLFLSLTTTTDAIRLLPGDIDQIAQTVEFERLPRFSEAPEYQNGAECIDLNQIHIAMTLDFAYLRGSIAAIHSVLKHTSCPENVFFHFIASESSSSKNEKKKKLHLNWTIQSTFPSLRFKIYIFNENLVNKLISSSIRRALENPLNYARSYLADILEPSIKRVIYLDSDIIVVDDIQKLWEIPLTGSRTIGAPEYCNANFTNYFTDEFWSDPEFSSVFEEKNACYFNTGVMVMDLERWRERDFTSEIEKWMEIQRERRIYELGSLPPFLLVFGGDVEAIDHRWNQHGLGGDNLMGKCRSLHPGSVSLMHWSGKGKPWLRLDAKTPCLVDRLWAPYDLYRPS